MSRTKDRVEVYNIIYLRASLRARSAATEIRTRINGRTRTAAFVPPSLLRAYTVSTIVNAFYKKFIATNRINVVKNTHAHRLPLVRLRFTISSLRTRPTCIALCGAVVVDRGAGKIVISTPHHCAFTGRLRYDNDARQWVVATRPPVSRGFGVDNVFSRRESRRWVLPAGRKKNSFFHRKNVKPILRKKPS